MIYNMYITEQLKKVLRDKPKNFSLKTNLSFNRWNLLSNTTDESDYIAEDAAYLFDSTYYEDLLMALKAAKSKKSSKRYKSYSETKLFSAMIFNGVDMLKHSIVFHLKTIDSINSIKLHYSDKPQYKVKILAHLKNHPETKTEHLLDNELETWLLEKKVLTKDDNGELYGHDKIISKTQLDVEMTLENIEFSNDILYVMAIYELLFHRLAKNTKTFINTFTINLFDVNYEDSENIEIINTVKNVPEEFMKRK